SRGDVFDVDLPGVGQHPVVIVTRDAAIPILPSIMGVMVTSKAHGSPAEVPLGPPDGLDHECVATADNIFTVPKRELRTRRGRLSPAALAALDDALRIALALD